MNRVLFNSKQPVLSERSISVRAVSRAWSTPTGFTLIELLVVLSILALLLTLATPRYMKAFDSGKDKVRAQNLATVRDAIDKFHADQGRYPFDLKEIVAKQYLRSIPLDPVSGTPDWVVIASTNPQEPGVFDISTPAPPTLEITPSAGENDQQFGSVVSQPGPLLSSDVTSPSPP